MSGKISSRKSRKRTKQKEAGKRNIVSVDNTEIELTERVIKMSRVAKVVKGGRRFSFSALTVVGDGDSYVGLGFGKAKEVPEAIRKSIENAKKNLFKVSKNENTIPHEITGKFKSARVLLKPGAPGTGIIAGEAVRAVIELGGIKDVLTKALGTNNQLNVAKATINALQNLQTAQEAKEKRGITLPTLFGTYSKKRRDEKRKELGIVVEEKSDNAENNENTDVSTNEESASES